MLLFIGWILTLLIISGSIIFGIYMDYCYREGVKMFQDPKYDKRIKKLEEEVEQMKKNIEGV